MTKAEKLGRETASFAQTCEEAKNYYLAKHTDKALKYCQRAEERHEQNKQDNITLTKIMGVEAYETFLKYVR